MVGLQVRKWGPKGKEGEGREIVNFEFLGSHPLRLACFFVIEAHRFSIASVHFQSSKNGCRDDQAGKNTGKILGNRFHMGGMIGYESELLG